MGFSRPDYSCNSTHLKLNNTRPITQFIFIIQEISQILNILAACLHLGNIEYTEVDDHTNSVAIREDIYLQNGTSFIFRILANIYNALLF